MKEQHRRRFRIRIFLQVLGITVTAVLLALTLALTSFIAAPAAVGFLIVLQVVALLRAVEAHVDTLEDFFAAVNYEDFTRQYLVEDVDSELKAAFNRIIDRFRTARAERDVQASYLETIVKHVPIPLLAARADGVLRLVNNPLKRLMGLANLKHIDDLAELDPALPEAMQSITAGQQRLLQTRLRGFPVELRVSVSEIRLAGEVERIYSIENLSSELSARESSAWRNLIRVLTHEIMNTLTPVASLAQTSLKMLDRPGSEEELREAIATIAKRSDGLTDFVTQYREYLQVPQPQPRDLRVEDALGGVVRLLRDELSAVKVDVRVVPRTLEVQADPALLDQVLVNLVHNALEAMVETADAALSLRGRIAHGRTELTVIDNGPGIPPNVREQIFIPFFTTKRTGSGIGLSLSRQIMLAHGGELVASSNGSGTTMTLLF